MRKLFFILPCLIVLLLCACDNSHQDSTASISSTVTSELTPLGQRKDGKSSQLTTSYAAAQDGLGVVFKYKIQDSYASRQEVEAEIERVEAALQDYLMQYGNLISQDESNQACEDARNVTAVLQQYIDEHFPLTEEEKKHKEDLEKEQSIYTSLIYAEDDLVIFKDSVYYESYERIYNQMNAIILDYEAGKITLDEAYDAIYKTNLSRGGPDYAYEYQPK